MIAALCVNPCLDKLVEIDEFRYGGMNRIRAARLDASGKGVNVAIALARLGVDSALVGLVPAGRSEYLRARLDGDRVPHELIPAPGEVRTNLKIYDRATSVVTEVNEGGVPADEAQIASVLAAVAAWAKKCDYMVFTGSLPPGAPKTLYAECMRAARRASGGTCRCVLDAEGEPFLHGLSEKPALVKPNTYELELFVGRKLESPEYFAAAASDLAKVSGGIVAVSMGGDGALLVERDSVLYAPRVPVDVISTVGAGDCMVAGILAALTAGQTEREAFLLGVAAGTASVTTAGTELIQKHAVDAMRPRVMTRVIDA